MRDRLRAWLPAVPVDPYRAAAGRWLTEDDIQAAAARLLLDGLVTISHRGNLALTGTGADVARTAGHRLPDALLAALRRRRAATTLGIIASRDPAFRAARAEFHGGPGASRARRAAAARGCLAATAVLLLTGELAFVIAALSDRLPQGPAQWAATAATGLASLAQLGFLARYDGRPGADGHRVAASEPYVPPAPHPALVELSKKAPEAAARLRAGRLRTTRRRNRERRRRRARATAAARMDEVQADDLSPLHAFAGRLSHDLDAVMPVGGDRLVNAPYSHARSALPQPVGVWTATKTG
ncbi:hypothetical protein ABZZ74_37550 [Streptomyces sp. NPDC006476]|uniref:hypothetical protein n=1 Tax=Streptomyces sp. NPDC006476 TaxID=3157175 RepID=UPI0033A051CC